MSDLIKTRPEFFRELEAAQKEVDTLVQREPQFPIWQILKAQLTAMQQWGTSPQGPTQEQLQRISIGLIAARELEPTPPELAALVSRLHKLNYAWRRWPLPM